MYHIKQLVNSHFGKKSNFDTFTQTSSSGPSLVLAPFASPSPTPGPSVLALANTPIYPTQPSGTRPTRVTYGTTALHTSGLGLILEVYIQSPSTRFSPAAHTLLDRGPIPAAYMQPPGIRPLSAAYKQPSGATPGEYIQRSGPISAAYI